MVQKSRRTKPVALFNNRNKEVPKELIHEDGKWVRIVEKLRTQAAKKHFTDYNFHTHLL